MSRLLYPRITAHCKAAKLAGNLDPIVIVGKLRQGKRVRYNAFAATEDTHPLNGMVSRFLDRVTLHLLVGQDSDATETLYREIDKCPVAPLNRK
jgi:hypothetical protein